MNEEGMADMNTLRKRVVLITVLCSLIMGISLGMLSYIYSGNMATEDSKEYMLAKAEEKQTQFNGILTRIQQSVDTLADISVARLTDFQKFKTDPNYVTEYTANIEDILLHFAERTEGALTAYVRYNPDFTDPTSGLFFTRDSTKDGFKSIEPTDFSTFEKDDLEHVGWYYIPVENKKPTWMNPYLNQNINVSMISYVVPIYMENESVGIIGMDISLETIEGMIAEDKIYDGGYSCMVDTNHNFVAHKDYALGDSLADSAPEVEKILADAEKEDQVVSYRYQGKDKVLAFLTLANGMKYILTAPESDVHAKSITLLKIMILFLFCGQVISFFVGFFVSGRISRPIRRVTEWVDQIAALNLKSYPGVENLTRRKDEIGIMARAVEKMQGELESMATEIGNSCTVVKSSTNSLEDVMRGTNDLCQNNSATMEEMSAGMQQSASTMEVILKNVENVNHDVQEINEKSIQGSEVSKEIKSRAVELEEHTREANERTKEVYVDLKEKSEAALRQAEAVSRIHELIQTISSISAQTNMLAMNASIEAARAGEAGKGFAVVASQIGSLAGKTQVSADDIKKMVMEVEGAVESMESCISTSTEFLEQTVMKDYDEFRKVGVNYRSDAGTFEEFMSTVHDLVETLSKSMEEIVRSLDFIGQALNDSTAGVCDIAEKTNELVGVTAHAEELVNQSSDKIVRLEELVDQFEVEHTAQ